MAEPAKGKSRLHLDALKLFFANQEQLVFTEYELLSFRRPRWTVTSPSKKKAYLRQVQAAGLKRIVLESAKYGPAIRYVKRNASGFQMGLSLRRGGYISHGSAAYLHDLTESLSRIFVNKEQTPKSATSVLTQQAINRAFANAPRESSLRYQKAGSRDAVEYVLLNGKNTQNLGVITLNHPLAGRLPVTNVARTLIDMSVRPQYGGGPVTVLRAFRKAKTDKLVEPGELFQTLQKLDYKYPYHQTVGFLMCKAGFERNETAIFKERGTDFDFYIAHAMDNPAYDTEWRVYYPRDLHKEFSMI